jgi:hypothetical protein
MEEKGNKGAGRRARRRENGMALKAGVSPLPTRDRLTRTVQLLRAALRLWEAKHEHLQRPRSWRKHFARPADIAGRTEGLDA